jgi:hypothetical protein
VTEEEQVVEELKKCSATWDHLKKILGESISPTIRIMAFERKSIGYSKRHGWAGGFYFSKEPLIQPGGFYYLHTLKTKDGRPVPPPALVAIDQTNYAVK